MTTTIKTLMFLLISLGLHAQQAGFDSLSSKRIFIETRIYKDGIMLSPSEVNSRYIHVPSASKDYLRGRIMMPAGVLVSFAGIYLGYDALKGEPKETGINGELYQYTLRSLPKLLIGIAGLAAGVSLIEYSNDLKARSARNYNKWSEKNKKPISMNFGLTPSSRIGLYANF
jgi:hypothetical protein